MSRHSEFIFFRLIPRSEAALSFLPFLWTSMVLSIMSEPLSIPITPLPARAASFLIIAILISVSLITRDPQLCFLMPAAHMSVLLLTNVSSDLLPALHQTIATAVAATDTEFLVFLQMLDTALSRSMCRKHLPYFFRVVCSSCCFPDWGWHVVIWWKLIFFYFYLCFLWSEGPVQKLANILMCFCALSGSGVSKFWGIFKACHVSQPNDVLGSGKSSQFNSVRLMGTVRAGDSRVLKEQMLLLWTQWVIYFSEKRLLI